MAKVRPELNYFGSQVLRGQEITNVSYFFLFLILLSLM